MRWPLRSSLVLVVAACVLGALGGASAAPAKASSGAQISWGSESVAVLPVDANADAHGGISSVSCASSGNCTAVGNYGVGPYAGHAGLLVGETAGQWSAGVEAVLPANASTAGQNTTIDSVSCSSAGNCSAVGSYVFQGGYWQGLLLTETAGVWSAGVEAVLPADGMGMEADWLTSISCTSPGNCSAVGKYFDHNGGSSTHGLLLTETDGSWAPGVEVALPAGAYNATLVSVSCVSAGNCTAVGGFWGSHGTNGLVVTETDGSWGPGVVAPLPADARTLGQRAGLTSVSCASAGNCTAVGEYNGVAHETNCDKYGCDGDFESEALLLTETAGSWSAAPAPALPKYSDGSGGVDSLRSVSCASPGNCTAVGSWVANYGYVETGLLLTETAGQWGDGALEPGASSDYGVTSVSCVTAGNCGAVTYRGTLLTQTDGAWTVGGTAGKSLSSVSCTPDGSCTAAGYGVLVGGTPASVTLNVATGGLGSGSISSDVGGIDCGSICSASVPGADVTLVAAPSPGSRFTGWSGGGCSGKGPCHPNTAVSGQTVTATFALLPWGGAATPPGASALNLGGNAQVTAISCADSQTCAAGGYYTDGSGRQAFVADEPFGSGSWGNAVKVRGLAALNTGHDARVTSISCANAGDCSAGGYYRVGGPSGATQAFVVNEDGGVWRTAREVPGTAALNRGSAQVTSISCAYPGRCVAGGEYESKTGHQAFVVIEKNGVWGTALKVPGTATLNTGGDASVTAVSCGAAGRCAVGGYYTDGKGKQAFLAYEKSGVWVKANKVPGTGTLNAGKSAQVTAVSCASATSCAAGGTYTDGSGHTQSFVVNGTAGKTGNWVWGTAVIVPGTAAALHVSGFSKLTSIACADAGYCSAVGQYSGPDGNQAFVVTSTNGKWRKAVEVPGIASLAGTSSAVAVSCASVGNCALTGSDDSAPGVFAAAETNGAWGDAASGDVAPLAGLDDLAASGSAQVTSISCSPAGTCAIGGSYGDSSSRIQPFLTSP